MEVFLGNVPSALSEKDLIKELKPVLESLQIVDWSCDKPGQRRQAWLRFPNERDGAVFLEKHGKLKQLSKPKTDSGDNLGFLATNTQKYRDIPRLRILHANIFAEKSRRKIEPGNISYHNVLIPRASKGKRGKKTLRCIFRNISCGKIVFAGRNDDLSFAEQCRINVKGYVEFGQAAIILGFAPTRIHILYSTIQDLITAGNDQSLTLVLTEPPRIFHRHDDADFHFHKPPWLRLTSVPESMEHAKYVANCLVYQISLADANKSTTIAEFTARQIIGVTRQTISAISHPEPYCHDYGTSLAALDGKVNQLATMRNGPVPYSFLFQVVSLVWNNFLHPASTRELLDLMEIAIEDASANHRPNPFTIEAMKQVFDKIPYPYPGINPADLSPMMILGKIIEVEQDLRFGTPVTRDDYGAPLPDHQVWVLKAMVTPSRTLLSGPEAESKNRVLHMFPGRSEFFLRVTFCDEDGNDLRLSPRLNFDAVYSRYQSILNHGICIAGRKFSFLGFSHSSLRSHSVWFVAPFTDHEMRHQDRDSILQLLGDFKDIRTPAKCAARIGQAFSEIPFVVPLSKNGVDVKYMADVKSQDGERKFSDGIGSISLAALEEVWKYLPENFEAPTCLQIRLAGIKGMLALDTRLKGKIIYIRPESMEKFPSKDLSDLGICDTSKRPLRLFLNRQMIKILEDMGTALPWFFQQQEKALRLLRRVTANAANTSTFLEHQDIGSSLAFPRFIRQLQKIGIDYRHDNLLRLVVESVVLRELRLLKHKTRILVEKGVTLFGVMDETGYLDEGEIYITYSTSSNKLGSPIIETSLVDGPVIVTRSPALHNGDIQLATMVTPPKGHPLRSLENCIVFSQRGKRDLPSQLSGGDLDGDLYNVIWDADAMPTRTFEPADYPRVSPPILDRDVKQSDIAEFFINFMKSDILGLIAVRHQIMADIRPTGTSDNDCRMLANLHSTAVDFSKTGLPVNINSLPQVPPSRPDFLALAPPRNPVDVNHIGHIVDEDDDEDDVMGKAKTSFHSSEKVLGRLYRGIDESKIWKDDIRRSIGAARGNVWKLLLEYVENRIAAERLAINYTRKLDEARKIHRLYNHAIREHMSRFSDNPRKHLTEVEVFCGTILTKTGTQSRRQRDSSTKLKDEMDRTMAWIVKMIRHRGAGGSTENTSSVSEDEAASHSNRGNSRILEEVVELCWACVVVGSERAGDDGDGDGEQHVFGGRQLESFRVVAGCCLLRELSELAHQLEAQQTAVSSSGGYVGMSPGYHRKPRQMVMVHR